MEKTQLGSLLADSPASLAALKPKKEHSFVREWVVADFANDLDGPSRGRNLRQTDVPDLTMRAVSSLQQRRRRGRSRLSAGAKYSRRDLLESFVEPSKSFPISTRT